MIHFNAFSLEHLFHLHLKLSLMGMCLLLFKKLFWSCFHSFFFVSSLFPSVITWWLHLMLWLNLCVCVYVSIIEYFIVITMRFIHSSLSQFLCLSPFLPVCVCVCVCVCMYVCMYVCNYFIWWSLNFKKILAILHFHCWLLFLTSYFISFCFVYPLTTYFGNKWFYHFAF